MSLSYYDLLDLDRSATSDEVRAAWRRAVDGLDPTDRRFRAYNAAAEVLLDPGRRAEYDAGLAADEADHEVAAGPDAREPSSTSTDSLGAAPAASARREAADERAGRRAGWAPRGWVPPGWLLLGLALATAVVAGIVAWLLTGPSDATVEEETRQAQAAAEQAVVPLLSYDAQDLEGSKQAAHEVLTDDYRKKYDQLFEGVVETNAPNTGTEIDVQVLASGIVRSGEDRAQVLLFVNRPTTNKSRTTPVVYRDQVTLTMQQVDGEWLVGGMETTPLLD